MDVFSFDHDDHPKLRERALSVDSVQGLDVPQEALPNLRVNSNKNTSAGLTLTNNGAPCPVFAPRPIAPAFAIAAGKASATAALTTAEGLTAAICPSPYPSLGLYQANNNSSSKHLPAFFHQVDREQAMTPESTFLTSRSQQANGAPATSNVGNDHRSPGSTGTSAQCSDNETEQVEYEVKIDQDFDAHAPQTTDSRGQSPRPGQLSAGRLANGQPGGRSANVSPLAGPRRPKHKMTPDDFKFLKVIGRGAYGKVYLVRHICTNALYAMKVLKKASIIVHAKDTECTMSERKILEAIRHPFIVKLHYAFQTDHRLYLILEYASGGELFTHLATERMFSEEITAFYAAQLVLALEHLHSLGIIYRDLKPENIMLNAHGDIVLTDFGLSKVPLENSDGRTNTVCGTIEYMAPEVISERAQYDRTVDWWSLGIVIHDMLTGSPPFVANNRKKTMDAILNKKLNLPYYLSSDAKDLLTKLLKRTPSARLGNGPKGIENIKNHRFFRKINWKLLALRELEPPIVPFLSDPESVENFNSEFTLMPVQESPIFTYSSVHINGEAEDGTAIPGSGHHTPSRYLTAPSSASSAGFVAALNGHDNRHVGGIPMAKTRSSSPDHHHFQDFSYISTSHLPSLGYLDDH
ncbi:kinase-like domain-containing protein [Gamsiella multidivaricata]|uniref:kinase-like domain-containing protein n=1 Tax=Gamsiella multidivaricata TaxID=101098 RepID=UPI002220CA86|nr:kinase-like domain-containing protein [Gamsiella multidivaricata]KAG0364780.1 serine/threonine protein kinase psk1 [Gamsiella multidivaricata]KAI7819903.1 kinase-like domain-containing protein [Gamsiella multidivaricata]